jgi:hypothetical protein
LVAKKGAGVPRISGPLHRGLTRVSLLTFILLAGGCADAQQGSQEEKSPQLNTDSFVGEIPSTGLVVAVVASDSEQGGNQRELRAYLCDGLTVDEWFTGSGGNEVQLSSANGAQLAATLNTETAAGTITLGDGRSIAFEASPATRVAGLYQVRHFPDGQVSGRSVEGGQLQAQLAPEPQEDGLYLVSGTVTAPDGQSQDFELFSTTNEAGQFRLIAFADEGPVCGTDYPLLRERHSTTTR